MFPNFLLAEGTNACYVEIIFSATTYLILSVGSQIANLIPIFLLHVVAVLI